MRNFIVLAVIFAVGVFLLQGCGGSGGEASLVDSIPVSSSGDAGDGAQGGEGSVGSLGELVDLGDLIYPRGDHWYYARVRAINDQGIVVGESNQGNSASGAFRWQPDLSEEQAMTFLGIHDSTTYFEDYYNQRIVDPVDYPHRFIFSEAVDINNLGIILCNSLTGASPSGQQNESEKRAFLFVDESFVDMPPIPGVLDREGNFIEASVNSYSEAVDINDKNEVVLTLDDNTESGRHAYYWDGSTFVDAFLPVDDGTEIEVVVPNYILLGGIVGQTSEAVAINENGQALINSGGNAIFVDMNWNVVETLNHLPGAVLTVAVDINDSVYTNNDNIPDGHVIGNSGSFNKGDMEDFLSNSYRLADSATTLIGLEAEKIQGFFWDGGAMYPVNHLGGGQSIVADLNNSDQVVGGALTAEGNTHAILWSLDENKKGVTTDLGTLGGANSMALSINEEGQVVGWAETGDFYEEQGVTLPVRHGFLWNNGIMYDLGTHDDFYDFPFKPPYPFSETVDINNAGEVAGNSITINDHTRGFYLSPEMEP